jgi:prepilin-type N-terminal cleavage/methylation domain-containing protein
MNCSKTRNTKGFTLIEVVVAVAILGIIVTFLLSRRLEIVRDAKKTRDLRVIWHLVAEKMSQIELQLEKEETETVSGSGEFEQFKGFSYAYDTEEKEIILSEPDEEEERIAKLNYVTLVITGPGGEKVSISSYFKAKEQEVPKAQ